MNHKLKLQHKVKDLILVNGGVKKHTHTHTHTHTSLYSNIVDICGLSKEID